MWHSGRVIILQQSYQQILCDEDLMLYYYCTVLLIPKLWSWAEINYRVESHWFVQGNFELFIFETFGHLLANFKL